MADPVSIAIASLSLAVSGSTLWFTLLRRGRVRMTHPAVVFFGYDYDPRISPKVFLRTLLYCTSVRGKVIEGMHVKLRHRGTERVFGFWGHGETNKLVPGSGLYVGQTGVAANHHFVLSTNSPPYEFSPGDYAIQVIARVVSARRPVKLSRITLTLTEEHASAFAEHRGVLFELDPETQRYVGSANKRNYAPGASSED
jgi:hypothetical protein